MTSATPLNPVMVKSRDLVTKSPIESPIPIPLLNASPIPLKLSIAASNILANSC